MSDLYAYALVYEAAEVDPDLLTAEIDKLDAKTQVVNWWAPFAGFMVLVSPSSATRLVRLLRKRTSLDGERFVVVDLDTDKNGWLPKHGWDFINDPRVADEAKE